VINGFQLDTGNLTVKLVTDSDIVVNTHIGSS
jgi:hypothetical protein